MTFNSMPELIGNTPLIKLQQVSELTGCTILGKAEFLNPGGSVKDRTALGIIRAAERDGSLRPGGTIVPQPPRSAERRGSAPTPSPPCPACGSRLARHSM